jgi:hypothetical protein
VDTRGTNLPFHDRLSAPLVARAVAPFIPHAGPPAQLPPVYAAAHNSDGCWSIYALIRGELSRRGVRRVAVAVEPGVCFPFGREAQSDRLGARRRRSKLVGRLRSRSIGHGGSAKGRDSAESAGDFSKSQFRRGGTPPNFGVARCRALGPVFGFAGVAATPAIGRGPQTGVDEP